MWVSFWKVIKENPSTSLTGNQIFLTKSMAFRININLDIRVMDSMYVLQNLYL